MEEQKSPSFWQSIFTGVVGAVATWLIIEFILKPRTRPKLKVKYDPQDRFCNLDVPAHKSVYHRLRVENVRYATAKRPRVYLVNVELISKDGPSPSDYRDGPLPLAWAYETAPEEHVPIKPREADFPLLKNTPDYADICMIRKNGQATLGLVSDPYTKYAALIQRDRVYRLTLQAVAEEAKPRKYAVDLRWDGTAGGLQIWPVQPRWAKWITRLLKRNKQNVPV